MKYLPYALIVLLATTTVVAVVTRPNPAPAAPTLSLTKKIDAACTKPWMLNDWWVDDLTPDLIRVSCYGPNGNLKYTVVER